MRVNIKDLRGKKVVLYTRFSTSSKRQVENSTERQKNLLYDFVQRSGVLVVGEYHDKKISGTKKCPKFQEMKRDILEGDLSGRDRPDFIVAEHEDRMSRKGPTETIIDFHELHELGIYNLYLGDRDDYVEVTNVFKEDEDIGEGITAHINRNKNNAVTRDTSLRVTDKNLELATSGRLCLKGSFGWKVEKTYGKNRIVEDFRFVPIKDEQKIVKEVFDHFLKTKSVIGCVPILQRHSKYRDKKDSVTTTTVKTILRDTRHCGVYTFGGSQTGKFNVMGPNGKRRKIERFDSPQRELPNHRTFNRLKHSSVRIDDHPSFGGVKTVSLEEFEEVQEVLDENSRLREKHTNRRPTTHKFSGLLKCKHCGKSLCGEKRATGVTYRCSKSRNKSFSLCNGSKTIRESLVEEILTGEIKSVLTDWRFHQQNLLKFVETGKKWRISRKSGQNDTLNKLKQERDEVQQYLDEEFDRDFRSPLLLKFNEKLGELDDKISKYGEKEVDDELYQLLDDYQELLELRLSDDPNLNLETVLNEFNGTSPSKYCERLLMGVVLLQHFDDRMIELEDGTIIPYSEWEDSLGDEKDEWFSPYDDETDLEGWLRMVGSFIADDFQSLSFDEFLPEWKEFISEVRIEWDDVEKVKNSSGPQKSHKEVGRLGTRGITKCQKLVPVDYEIEFTIPYRGSSNSNLTNVVTLPTVVFKLVG